MSDLNDLIHTNATIAFNQGAQREQERILKLIDTYKGKPDFTLANLKSLIKAGQQ
jgi:hypothetical protein